MRGVAVFLSGLVLLSGIVLVSGAILEPILEIVADNPAVQSLGMADDATQITDTILKYVPLLFIAYLLAWALVWYVRIERFSQVRR